MIGLIKLILYPAYVSHSRLLYSVLCIGQYICIQTRLVTDLDGPGGPEWSWIVLGQSRTVRVHSGQLRLTPLTAPAIGRSGSIFAILYQNELVCRNWPENQPNKGNLGRLHVISKKTVVDSVWIWFLTVSLDLVSGGHTSQLKQEYS